MPDPAANDDPASRPSDEPSPGPWIWFGTDPGFRDYETGNWEDPPSPACVIAGTEDDRPDEHNTIAWMNNCHPEEVQEANARLLAAAWDYYQAVERLQRAEGAIAGDHNETGNMVAMAAELNAARADLWAAHTKAKKGTNP